MSKTTVLEVDNMYKEIDGNVILNDLSFQLHKNEIVSIIGPSGAGKTTLVKILNGLTSFNEGKIQYGSDLVVDNSMPLPELYEQIGLVFQNFNLFPHLNVLKNITLSQRLKYRKNKNQIDDDAKKWLRLLRLEDKEFNYPFQLSGGQKQRVAIARAAIMNPNILCFDEPTSALDPALSNEVANVIRLLSKENMSVLIITHDMEFAKQVSDRIIELDEGRIINNIDVKDYFK